MAIKPEQFVEAGCQLASPFDIFVAVYGLTRGDPCKTGCTYFDGGRCDAYRQLFPDAPRPLPRPKESKTAGYVAPTKKPFRW